MFKIAKKTVESNQTIINKQCINDGGKLAVSHEDDKIAWKRYLEKLLNTEFAWDKNSLSQPDKFSSVPNFKDNMVRESINKMNEKTA